MSDVKDMYLQAILDCPMDQTTNDASAVSVGDYLLQLAREVWIEDEGFSGKRPFGNSGWRHDIYIALSDAGLMAVEEKQYNWGVEYEHTHEEEQRIDKLILMALSKSRIRVVGI